MRSLRGKGFRAQNHCRYLLLISPPPLVVFLSTHAPPEFSSASGISRKFSTQVPLQSARRSPSQMKKFTIAVGSKRGPKLNAVKEALEAISGVLARETQFEVIGVEVESGAEARRPPARGSVDADGAPERSRLAILCGP